MEGKSFWWLKSSRSDSQLGRSLETNENITSTTPLSEGRAPSSLSCIDYIDDDSISEEDVDIGSIIEEMNRLAAQSPLGPFKKDEVSRFNLFIVCMLPSEM